MTSIASPGLPALTRASRVVENTRAADTIVGEFFREQTWEQGTIESQAMEEVYFMFRHSGATCICSLRRYKSPSPRFHSIMDHTRHAWVCLGIGSTPRHAFVALYNGESDHPLIEVARKFAAAIRNGTLVEAWDKQTRQWGLETWGFHVDGLTVKYGQIFKDHAMSSEQIGDGQRWLRVMPETNNDG